MSRSMIKTVKPRRAISPPRLAVRLVLRTPPLPLITEVTRARFRSVRVGSGSVVRWSGFTNLTLPHVIGRSRL